MTYTGVESYKVCVDFAVGEVVKVHHQEVLIDGFRMWRLCAGGAVLVDHTDPIQVKSHRVMQGLHTNLRKCIVDESVTSASVW